jgi:hypothetical protein
MLRKYLLSSSHCKKNNGCGHKRGFGIRDRGSGKKEATDTEAEGTKVICYLKVCLLASMFTSHPPLSNNTNRPAEPFFT